MNQPTFADLEYECKKRKTRRELFLERRYPQKVCKQSGGVPSV